MPLLDEITIQNIIDHFELWLEDQRIRRFHHDGLSSRKIYRLERDLEVTLPQEYTTILKKLGTSLTYTQVEMYREQKLVEVNLKTQQRRPQKTLAFACHANGGIFCFENITNPETSVLLFSEKYKPIWKPKCSFKRWYQLLQIYSWVESKNYFHQEESETWSASAIEEWKAVYQYLSISPYDIHEKLLLF